MSINNLPKWCLTDTHPAVHDHDSLTAIEMVSRLYGKMQELVSEYNKFNADILKEIEAFESGLNSDYELFKITMQQKFQDFIDIVDLKLSGLNQKVDSTVNNIKMRLQDAVNDMVKKMKEQGELNDAIMGALGDYDQVLNELLAKEQSAGAGRTVATGTLQKIIETATSYLKHNNDLVYAHKHNTKETPGKDYGNSAFVLNGEVESWPRTINGALVKTNQYGRTGKAINCSTFALLVAMGVPYEQSRYNPLNVANKWGSAGYCFNMWQEEVTTSNYEVYYNTQKMYERMAYLGCAGPIFSDFSNVSAGDLVFFAPEQTNEAGEVIAEAGTVEAIGHVGVVLATHHNYGSMTDTRPKIVIAESTSATNTIQFNSYTVTELKEKYVCFVGKPAYNYIPQQESEVLYKCNVSLDSHALLRDYNLQNGELVTLEFDYTPTNTENYLTVLCQVEGTNKQHRLYASHQLKELTKFSNTEELNKTYHMTITMPLSVLADGEVINKPFDVCNINRINVNVNAIGSNEATVLTNLKVWRGLPTEEKTKILYPINEEHLKTLLFNMVPDVTADYQEKISLIVRPLETLKYVENENTEITLIKADYYFDVYIRALYNKENKTISKRLVAKSFSGINDITLAYTGSAWHYATNIVI